MASWLNKIVNRGTSRARFRVLKMIDKRLKIL
jgi:hypothetical protein